LTLVDIVIDNIVMSMVYYKWAYTATVFCISDIYVLVCINFVVLFGASFGSRPSGILPVYGK